MTTEKFIPPLDVPDRDEDYDGYSHAVHFNALARAGWERRAERTPSGSASFGGTLNQPTRLNLGEVA